MKTLLRRGSIADGERPILPDLGPGTRRLLAPLAGTAARARSVALRGNTVACPCCRRAFRAFDAQGSCPGCGSMPRHRFMALVLRRGDLLRPGVRVLHFAPAHCIAGVIGECAGGDISYLSTDLDPDLAQLPNDITDLDLRDDRFDLIVCSHVLEHVSDDREAIRELYRVLRPGGTALVQVPVRRDLERTRDEAVEDPALRRRLYGQVDHVRAYGADIERRLGACGFEVARLSPEDRMPDSERARMGLNPRPTSYRGLDVFACLKPAVQPAD